MFFLELFPFYFFGVAGGAILIGKGKIVGWEGIGVMGKCRREGEGGHCCYQI